MGSWGGRGVIKGAQMSCPGTQQALDLWLVLELGSARRKQRFGTSVHLPYCMSRSKVMETHTGSQGLLSFSGLSPL